MIARESLYANRDFGLHLLFPRVLLYEDNVRFGG